jgi:Cu(I)/Ag(I) efflux system protein CusF
MNRWTILAAAAALSTASLLAVAGSVPATHGATHDHAVSAGADQAAYSGVGVVRKVDAAQGKVTLQHEPIESLGWPAMTMAFHVKDGHLLAGLEPGRKVRFAFLQQGPQYVITAIE